MTKLYAVIDCAADPSLHRRVLAEPGALCLFVGTLDSALAQAVPHLVPLTLESPLLHFLQGAQGRLLSCGVVIESELATLDLWSHLRRFLQAMYPDGTVGLLRFYDPRVLHPLLISGTTDQVAPWFTKIDHWIAFHPDRTLRYGLRGGVLQVGVDRG